MKKRKIVSFLENEIILFLKKNRVFSKTQKLSLTENDNESYLIEKVNNLKNINYIIFQDKIYNNNIYRFLYTLDTYVFILNNELLLLKVKELFKNNINFKKIIIIENGKLEYV